MLLLEQLTFSQAHCLFEAQDKPHGEGKDLYMSGIFVQGGVRNFNQRVYPVREIQGAVDAVAEKLKDGNILGECDHPEELTINLDRVSHEIVKMWMDGPNGMGKLKILPTPMGNIIRSLIESNIKLGVSSRGVGNVDDRGEVSGFEMITVDVVANPSAPNAFPKAIYEGLNSRRGRVIEDLAIAVSHDRTAQKHLYAELNRWIKGLS